MLLYIEKKFHKIKDLYSQLPTIMIEFYNDIIYEHRINDFQGKDLNLIGRYSPCLHEHLARVQQNTVVKLIK